MIKQVDQVCPDSEQQRLGADLDRASEGHVSFHDLSCLCIRLTWPGI